MSVRDYLKEKEKKAENKTATVSSSAQSSKPQRYGNVREYLKSVHPDTYESDYASADALAAQSLHKDWSARLKTLAASNKIYDGDNQNGFYANEHRSYKNLVSNGEKLIRYYNSAGNSKAASTVEEQIKSLTSTFRNISTYNRYATDKQQAAMSVDETQAALDKLVAARQAYEEQNGGKFINRLNRFTAGFAPSASAGIVTTAEKNIGALSDYDTQINEYERLLYNKKGTQALDGLPEDAVSALDEIITSDYLYEGAQWQSIADSMSGKRGSSVAGNQIAGAQRAKRDAVSRLKALGCDNWQELAEYRKYQTDREAAQKEAGEVSTFATEHPVLSSAASIALAPAKALALAEVLKSATSVTDAPVNTASPYFFANRVSNGIRDTVMENTAWNVNLPVFGSTDAFDFLYGTGMSMLDSVTAAAFGNVPGSLIIGAQAMTDSIYDATERGLDAKSAIITGTLAGVFETLFEKVSISQFNALKETGIKNLFSADGVKTLLKNMGKSTLTNATEETFTEIANIVTDTALNGGASDYAQKVEYYMSQGMTENDARSKAATDLVQQVFEAGAGGALMGTVMGGTGSAIGSARNSTGTKATGQAIIDRGNVAALTNAAQNISTDENAELYKVAQKLAAEEQARSDGQKPQLSDRKYARLTGKLQDATYSAATQTAVTERLNSLGESGDVSAVASAVVNTLSGESLSRAQQKALTSSKYAQRVINEFSSVFSNEAGGYTNDWSYDLLNRQQNIADMPRVRLQQAQDNASTPQPQKVTPENTTASTGVYGKNTDISSDDSRIVTVGDKTYSVADIEAMPPEQQQLYLKAGAYEADEAQKYITHYDLRSKSGKVSLESFDKSWSFAHRLGQINRGKLGAEYVVHNMPLVFETLGAQGAQAAINYGSAISAKQLEQKNKAAVAKTKADGKYKNSAYNDSDIDALYDALSAKTGVDIERVNEIVAGTDESGSEVYANAQYRVIAGVARAAVAANADSSYTDAVHELNGHHLAATNKKAYKAVLDAATDWWIEKKGFASYDERISSIEKQQGLSYTDAQEEFVSEFIAGLFSTDDGINDFMTWLKDESGYSEQQRKTVLQKLLDLIDKVVETIKSLVKSGNLSDTAREAMTVEADKAKQMRKIVLDGLNEGGTVQDGEVKNKTKYSVKHTDTNKPVAVIEDDILNGVPKSQWVKTVKETISDRFSGGVPISGRLIKVNKITRNEYSNSKYSKFIRDNNGQIYTDKFKSANNLDDIVIASTNYINEDLKHSRNDSFKEFARGDVLIRVGNNDYSAKVIVGFTSGKEMVLYDVIDFTPDKFEIRKSPPYDQSQRKVIRSGELLSDPTVPQTDTGSQDNSMQESEKDTTKNSLKSKKVDRTNKTSYNEFNTLAMQWANSANAKQGDIKRLFSGKNGNWCLVMADELSDGGYRILGSGTYEEVTKVGREYNRVDESVYRTSQRIESAKRGSNSIMRSSEDGGNDTGSIRGSESRQLQTNAAGSDERLRGSDNEVSGDIEPKYSLQHASPDLVKQNQRLIRENDDYKETVAILREQFRLTRGHKLNEQKVRIAANKLRTQYKSSLSLDELTQKLNTLYTAFANDRELVWDDWYQQSEIIAKEIVDSSAYNYEIPEESKELLRTIRGATIKVSDMQKREAAYFVGGTYNDFWRTYFGRMRLSDSGIPLDSQWQEWSAQYPEWFDGDIAEPDQIVRLAEITTALSQNYSDDYSHDADETAAVLAIDIMENYYSVPEITTFSDKKKNEKEIAMNRLRQHYKEIINNSRADAKARQEKALLDLRQQKNERIKQLTEKYNEALDKVRQDEANKLEKSKLEKDWLLANQHREDVKKYQEQIKQLREKRDAALERQALRYRDSIKESREKRLSSASRAKLYKLVLDTTNWLTAPKDGRTKCPDFIREPYSEFLSCIDFSSKRLLNGGEATQKDIQIASALDSLATAVEKARNAQDPEASSSDALDIGYLDLPENFVAELRDVSEAIKHRMEKGNFTVNEMDSDSVKNLSRFIRTLNHSIREMGKLYANERYANASDAGKSTIRHTDSLGATRNEVNRLRDFAYWKNALPYYAFKRFGEGGIAIFEELMDSQDKLAFLSKVIDDFKADTWTDKQARKWSNDTHEIKLSGGQTATLTTADAMSIYCLSKRLQALGHIFQGGINIIGAKKGIKQEKSCHVSPIEQDIEIIVKTLSKEQIGVADAIQQFMSVTCAEWGNEISLKRFLTRMFTEKYYFPIESNKQNLNASDPKAQQSDLFRLLNISAAKPLTQGANNEIVIRNIFEVFTNHACDMAKLNSYGMALIDYMKWINYRETTKNSQNQISVKSVRGSIENAYGKASYSYVLNLIKDINGTQQDLGEIGFSMRAMRAAKIVAVANNLRVALLQGTSYLRAQLVLSPADMIKAFSKKPQVAKAEKYCGIALWKSLGFFDTGINRSMESRIMGTTSVYEKVIDASLKGAEMGDKLAWGYLWNACEFAIQKEGKYKFDSEEFNVAVGKKLREVVYATQVVDSTLTRTEVMRSKAGLAQMNTSFMSETMLSYNILMDAYSEFNQEKRKTGSAKGAIAKTGKYVARAITAYTSTALLAAMVEAIVDSFRDDDDDDYLDKLKENFIENLVIDLNPFNKLPLFSDLNELIGSKLGIGFFSSERLDIQYLTTLNKALTAWAELIDKGSSANVSLYYAIYNTTKSLSQFSGLPISNAMREAVTVWNNTFAQNNPSLKVRMYGLNGEQMRGYIYDALVEGRTSLAAQYKEDFKEEKDYTAAVRKALREYEPRVKLAAKSRFDGGTAGYWKYAKQILGEKHFTQNDVLSAINSEVNALKEDSESAASDIDFFKISDYYNSISHGDTATAKIVFDELVSEVVAKGDAKIDAEKSVKSSFVTECGNRYVDGTLTESKAVDYITKYGGKDKDDAEEKIRECDFEKKYGYAYSQWDNAYRLGDISEQQLVSEIVRVEEIDRDDAVAEVQVIKFKDEYPDLDIETSTVKKYYSEVEDTGISVKDFNDYYNKAKQCKGVDKDGNGRADNNSKKDQILVVINAMNISTAQKDALYRLNGWSDKNLYDAPWH